MSDPDGDRWDDNDILDALNEALILVVDNAPSVNMRLVELALITNTHKQFLPDNIARIREFSHTILVADDGTESVGGECTRVDIDDLGVEGVGWRSEDSDGTVVHYLFTDATDREFFVYPAQPSQSFNNRLVGTMAVYPAEVTNLTEGSVDMHRRYKTPVADIVASRLLNDEPDPDARARAQEHMDRGYQALGIKLQVDAISVQGNES